jgi:anti-anti-sigma regulatory factor
VKTSKLTVASTSVDNGCLVRLAGTIDESTDAQALVPNGADVVVFDLDGVRRITSYGVLQWVKALKDLRARYYGFMRCRPSIVRQFNMVAGFGKHGELLSVYLPYFCEGCDQEFESLLDLRADFALAQASSPPDTRCSRCGEPTEFDDVPKSYFAFSSDYPRPNPPELALKLMQEATRLGGLTHRDNTKHSTAQPKAPRAASDAFPASESRTLGSLVPPRDEGTRESLVSPPPARETEVVTSAAAREGSDARPGSVDRLRKLQDELDVTRDRLSRMLKEHKSKS